MLYLQMYLSLNGSVYADISRKWTYSEKSAPLPRELTDFSNGNWSNIINLTSRQFIIYLLTSGSLSCPQLCFSSNFTFYHSMVLYREIFPLSDITANLGPQAESLSHYSLSFSCPLALIYRYVRFGQLPENLYKLAFKTITDVILLMAIISL